MTSAEAQSGCITTNSLTELSQFFNRYPRLVVITGAGLSTPSQIPDYRDCEGNWKRRQPVMFYDFMNSELVRKRYWARSLVGWQHFSRAKPNPAHFALADLEKQGYLQLVVTQNVDNLHQLAGQQQLLALHGTITQVKCMTCNAIELRIPFQERMIRLNPAFADLSAEAAPDGDAELEDINFSAFNVPVCQKCGNILKPDVVFYGESVPRERHQKAETALEQADAVLIAGSSMMVYSGYRLAKKAHRLGIPLAALNLGTTRADPLLDLKIKAPIEKILPELVTVLKN